MSEPAVAGVDHRRTDTREKILAVALHLFAARGYATTSLREIADELGVTKAALYFHFKTKEDIVGGILLGHLDALNALAEEAGPDGATPAGQERLLRRLSELHTSRSKDLVKLIRENVTEIKNLPFGAQIHETQRRLLEALTGPDATLIEKTRARTAFVAISSAAMHPGWEDATEQEVREAALTVALEVLRGPQVGVRTESSSSSAGVRDLLT